MNTCPICAWHAIPPLTNLTETGAGTWTFSKFEISSTIGVKPPTSESTENDASIILVAWGHAVDCSMPAVRVADAWMVKGFGSMWSHVALIPAVWSTSRVRSWPICGTLPFFITTLNLTLDPASTVEPAVNARDSVLEAGFQVAVSPKAVADAESWNSWMLPAMADTPLIPKIFTLLIRQFESIGIFKENSNVSLLGWQICVELLITSNDKSLLSRTYRACVSGASPR
jgi:hypothetical protein